MARSRIIPVLLIAVILLTITACNDDDNPSSFSRTPIPTMENIWPHDDGNAWTFEGTYAEYPEIVPAKAQPADEAPLPSLSELHMALQSPQVEEPNLVNSGLFQLTFDGEVETDSGVIAQHLRETMYVAVPGSDELKAVEAATVSDRLLRLIAPAHPELRAAIKDDVNPQSNALVRFFAPILLNGYAFAYEDSGYYSYGDFDTDHSWTYLTSSLDVGTEFSQQLVPALTNDLWLYGQIWSVGDLTVGGHKFQNVVECMYLVDMGIQVGTDESGTSITSRRTYIYGTVHYAPEVGPIRLRQRSSILVDDILQNTVPFSTDYVMDLVGATSR